MLSADLSGRHAIVTGASSGLGRHFVVVLARAGARVTLAARRLPALEEAASMIASVGGSVDVVSLDVTDAGSVAAAFSGEGPPFDIVINNAGMAHNAPALQTSAADL